MAVPKANQRAVNKYVKANYDRINVTMPKGEKEVIQGCAAAHGESVNGFIMQAVRERMKRDSGAPPEIAQNGPEATAGAEVVSLSSEALKVAQETTETGIQPAPADKVKAAENLFRILGDLGTVDLDKARCERLGIMYLPPDILEAAQQAAEAAGEAVAVFIDRAVTTQAKRDEAARKLGDAK